MLRGTIIVVAKAPMSGCVKTRLGRDIGMVRAANLFRVMTCRTVDAVVDAKARCPYVTTRLVVTPHRALFQHHQCWQGIKERLPQSNGDLGGRLSNMILAAPPGPIVIIGTDAPQIQGTHLIEALRYCSSHDAVFGPAQDGGFWLMGLARRRPAPNIFQGVRWSSKHTLKDTKESLPSSYKIQEMETLRDIDTVLDMRALGPDVLRSK